MKERNVKYVLLLGFLAELSEAALYAMALQALISSCSKNLLFSKGRRLLPLLVQCIPDKIGSVVYVEFLHDVRPVSINRSCANKKLLSDLRIIQSVRDIREDFLFTAG